MSDPAANRPSTPTETTNSPQRKPFSALGIATVLGLGYIPSAPGTFGSLMGVALAWVSLLTCSMQLGPPIRAGQPLNSPNLWWLDFLGDEVVLILIVSVTGIWTASRVAKYLQSKDPQIVVIDEVAGQLISYLGLATPRTFSLNWKYLVLGFILFRVFDIWKPFPARQAESLPGGLGIMADDWIAGIYAALGLWIARALGL